MDFEAFKNSMKNSSDVVNKNRMLEIMKASYRAYPNEINRIGINNLICANEELSELQIEVSKILRGRSAIFKQDTDREQYLNDRYKLLEELADSYLAIQYIKDICNISDSDFNKAINAKLTRQEERNGNAYF